MKKVASCVASVIVAVLIPACGSSDAPIDDVPALANALQALDDAVVAEDYREARVAIGDLKSLTTEARNGGTLTDDAARQIMKAAAAVAADLRELQPARSTASPTPSATPPQGNDEGDEEQGEDEGGDQGAGGGNAEQNGEDKHGGEPVIARTPPVTTRTSEPHQRVESPPRGVD